MCQIKISRVTDSSGCGSDSSTANRLTTVIRPIPCNFQEPCTQCLLENKLFTIQNTTSSERTFVIFLS